MQINRINALLLALLIAMLLSTTGMSQGDESKAWSIIATYQIPEGAAGLAFDGTYLYCGIYGSGNIYRINPANGSYSLLFVGPQEDAYGLTYDGQYLWTTDHPSSSLPAKAMKLNWDGTLASQFNLITTYMSGIAYDNGDFWVARYYPDPSVIYKVNSAGTVLKQFTAPDNQPWDLCLANDDLWVADYWGDRLYKVDTASGATLDSHASEGIDPAGIVWDGQFLWYCDNGQDYTYDLLYKVDLSGSGTPSIYVPVKVYDFGIVTVNESSTWNVTVQNTGTIDLRIDSVTFGGSSELSSPTSYPVTIGIGNQTQLSIVYAPLVIGPLNATATIYCNDPIHPTVDLTLTGNAVNPGPEIYLPENAHNYDTVRTGANTRWLMTIQNIGDQVLTITGISSSDAHFIVDDRVTFPLNIGLLSSTQIGIWFRPEADVTYNANLTINSNDPNQNPCTVPVQGIGFTRDYPMGDSLWEYQITGGLDNSPKAMAPIPDINGDGVADLIVCSEDNYVRCFNGNAHKSGDVLWEHYINAGAIYNQNSLAIIQDIDEDGYSDVVVGSAWGGRLIRAISGKTGQEIWTHDTHEYGTGGWVYQVDCKYDYNNDGVADVLAATGNDGTNTGPKRVYCLNGLTGASIWECMIGGAVFGVIGVEDFTGDGIPDAVAGATNAGETAGRAVGINGATHSIVWSYPTSGTSVWALVQVDDINGDGTKDVAIGDFSMSAGIIYGLNAKTGGQLYARPGFGPILRLIKMDDLNGDGHPDIIPAHSSSTAYAVNGQTGAIIWNHPLVDKPHCVVRATDVSGDGINDVFLGTLYTNNYCYFLDGTNGSELTSINLNDPIDAITAIPDIVGDGSMEMVAGGRTGGVYCFSGGLNAVINQPPLPPSIDGPMTGKPGISYNYEFLSTDPEGNNLFYYIEWGDDSAEQWIGPYPSDEKVDVSHSWSSVGNYTIRAKTKDIYNAESPWSEPYPVSIAVICGDANSDGIANVSDAVYIINYVFLGGNPPVPFKSGDANCDTQVNVSDAVYIISYVFAGGHNPCDTNGDGLPDC